MYTLILVDYNSMEKTIEYVEHCWSKLGDIGASHVVIVENGTQKNCESLLGKTYGGSEKKFVMQDQTVYLFEKGLQKIAYCNSGANLGYAKGNNLGCKIAAELWNDPFYIISNNDLYFEKEPCLKEMHKIFEENAEVGIIGPRIVTPAKEQQSPKKWQSALNRLVSHYWVSAFAGLLGNKKGRYTDVVQGAKTGFCDWISGCFFFVRADAFRKICGFDEYTFLYAEEMILAKRMEKINYRVYFFNEMEVVHQHGVTTKKAHSAVKTLKIEFQSNCYFYKQYMGTSSMLLAFAKMNFGIFSVLFRLKQKIKSKD